MTPVRIYKLDAASKPVLHYDGVIVDRGTDWVYVKAIFQIDVADMGFVRFERGDVFHEWFYTNRWYNVFRIEDGTDGRLKGWYCNITRPATITANSIRADDLALDVYVMPDATLHILDEEEFTALGLPPHEQKQAWAAVDEIRRLVAQRAAPFDALANEN